MTQASEIENLIGSLTSEVINLNTTVNDRNIKQDETNERVDKAGRRQLLAFIAAVVVGGISLFGINSQTVRLCQQSKNDRAVLKQVIVSAYNSPTGSLNLRAFPAYANLDPNMKAWVNQFQAVISLGSTTYAPNDSNKNHVPDDVEAILNQKVC